MRFFFLMATVCISSFVFAQTKVVFNSNVTFTVPKNWYIKDSSATRIMLRKTGDTYSKIELKIYGEKEANLVKYTALDKKKFSPDKHIRTVMPAATLGGKAFTKVKYFNGNKVVISNTEMEYVIQFKPKVVVNKLPKARLETIVTYSLANEKIMLAETESLVSTIKF